MRNAKYCVFWLSIRENHNIFRYQQVRIRFNLLVRVSDSPDRNVSFLTAPNNVELRAEGDAFELHLAELLFGLTEPVERFGVLRTENFAVEFARDKESRAFGKADHFFVAVVGEELFEAVFTRFVVETGRAARDEVRVRLERAETEGVEGRRFGDRHVVRRAKRRAGDVAARGPADVGHAGVDAVADEVDDAGFVHAGRQRPGVAAAHGDGFGLLDGFDGVVEAVDRNDLVAVALEGVLHLLFVAVVGAAHAGIRNKP